MRRLLYPLLFSALFAFVSCSKWHPDPTPPAKDELPAITQEGKMTIGCLLNDTVLIPKGYTGRSNPSIHYDPTNLGGELSITMYHIDQTDSVRQYLIIGGSNINKTGTYDVSSPAGDVGIQYSKVFKKTNSGCEYHFSEPGCTQLGKLTIIRLDLTQKIIAGTFSFALTRSGCDTVRFSQGRFDLKF